MSEEVPPQWMWPLEDQLDDWFEEVKRRRDDKYGGGRSEEDGPMMGNELTKGMR